MLDICVKALYFKLRLRSKKKGGGDILVRVVQSGEDTDYISFYHFKLRFIPKQCDRPVCVVRAVIQTPL